MRVLATGGGGRVGRVVVAALAAEHELVIFDRQPPAAPLPGHLVVGEVAELGQLCGAMAGAEAVVHLAAIPSPLHDPPEVVFRNNVMAAFAVAEAAAICGARHVVHVSSGSALGFAYRARPFIPDYLPMDEAHPLRPQDAYGLSKALGEEILAALTRRTGIPTTVLRPPAVLVPETAARRSSPTWMRAIWPRRRGWRWRSGRRDTRSSTSPPPTP